MRATERGSLSAVRWGWLLTTLALGASLCVASWANYRSVKDAVSTIQMGQARVFEGMVMSALRGDRPLGAAQRLDSLVAAQADAGLRFVGLLSPDVGPTTLGGTSSGEFGAPVRLGPGPNLVVVGDRIRFFVRPASRQGGDRGRPQRPPPPQEVDRGTQRPGPRAQGRDRPEPQTLVVVEFEPLVAGQLMSQAVRSLTLGVVAAALLMLTAFLFWQATLRREAEERVLRDQRRLSTLGEMSAVLAHEIRNPLASLKGHAQLLAERIPAGAAEKGRVDRIVLEAQRLEALTTDLLDFARTGPMDLKLVSVDALIAEVVGAADWRVQVDVSRAPESWYLDASRMRQVLSNLIRNAVEASPDGGIVSVTAWGEGSALVIAIRDSGEGVAEESAQRMFEPFFTTRTKGTGLGLAVARRIVELHGGTLTAQSLPEGGAELRIVLARQEELT